MITAKELRDFTGLSQSKFAAKYNIPINTLRKWEQGVAVPSDYLILSLAQVIGYSEDLYEIKGKKGIYKYDDINCKLMDDKGNIINIKIPDYKQISLNNLGLYCDFLFKDYTDEIDWFLRQCREDLKSDIEWTTFDDC